MAGDRIAGLNGEEITSAADINRLLYKASVAEPVKFIIAMGNQIKENSVVLLE